MRLFFLGFMLVMSGCATLQSVSMTPIPKQRSKQVSASAEKFIFFALNFDNDFVDEVHAQLRESCLGGRVQGILTKDEHISYLIAHRRIVTANGFCVK